MGQEDTAQATHREIEGFMAFMVEISNISLNICSGPTLSSLPSGLNFDIIHKAQR